VKKVCEKLPSMDIAVQQEQPLAPPALATASVNADSTMTSSKHKGTVYPDISALHYLLAVNTNFRTLTFANMGHNEIEYLVCAELKRSIKRAYIRQGLNAWNKGYNALLKSLRSAALQAERQAFVAMQRPGQANSDVILLAAVGPFWIWCLASRVQLLNFSGVTVEEIESDESFTPTSSALLSPMSKEQIFSGYDDDLPKKNFLDGCRISVGYRHVAKISALLWSRDSSTKVGRAP